MNSKQKAREGLKGLAAMAGLVLVLAGCASADVNPAQARPKTGYVDLHANQGVQYCWQVSRFDTGTQSFQSIFSSFDPPQQGIVRVALAPERYRLKVELLNRLTTGPLEVEVTVEDGKITPVRLTVARVGTGEVETVETNVGGTLYGRYGRNTHYGDDAEAKYSISGTAEAAIGYRMKGEMPYVGK